ncbi:hypothetical protein IWZ03DRAFT_212185 [Phyllosticta citriasiana]|uniref:RRM domain-containing protein n=1 Tax=Phyllosticta citriasiana TaxID=595635 RepID=A0ABR1KJC0_9PEZI
MSPDTPSAKLQEQSDLPAQLSTQEAPSPASTYGQTLVGGDSIPATPGSDSLNEPCQTASSCDTADRSDEAHDQSEDAPPYKFEEMLDRCKNASAAVRRGLSLTTCGSSPAKLTSMVQDLSINRHARSNSCFVRGIEDDSDVFGHRDAEAPMASTSDEDMADVPAKQFKPANVKPADVKPVDFKPVDFKPVDVEPVDVKPATESPDPFSPRPGKKGHMVTADNAQAHYKPECCIFVANLPTAQPDDIIRSALSELFSRFGKCFIKLKRDRGMPIAFVQFDNAADADKALGQGDSLFVLGRKCRTERAKAPRCLYVSRRDGSMPTEDEVLRLMENRGEIEKTWVPSDTDQEVHKLAPGFFVKFVYYQDAVDAINALRDRPTYNVEAQQTPRSAIALFDPSSVLTTPYPNSRAPLFDASQHDSRALWVGELPDTVTKSDLARVFGGPGREIGFIELRIRSNTDRSDFMSYAFIHYKEPQSAFMAARMTFGTLRLFNKRNVKVQYARKPYWQLAGRMAASPYRQNVAYQNMPQQHMVQQSMAQQSMAQHNIAQQNMFQQSLVQQSMTQQSMAQQNYFQHSMVQQNMAYGMDGFTSTSQHLNMTQVVPAFTAQQPFAFYGNNFYNEYPQANYMYSPEVSYGMPYMSSDMNNQSAAYPFQYQDLSGSSYMFPQAQMGNFVPPSFGPAPAFYFNQ